MRGSFGVEAAFSGTSKSVGAGSVVNEWWLDTHFSLECWSNEREDGVAVGMFRTFKGG